MSRQHCTFTKLHRYSTERDASIPYDTIPIRDSTQRLGTVRHPTGTVPNATLQSQNMTAQHMTGLYPHTTTPCLTVTPRSLTSLRDVYTQLGHTLHYINETEHHRTILGRAVTILGCSIPHLHVSGQYRTRPNPDKTVQNHAHTKLNHTILYTY